MNTDILDDNLVQAFEEQDDYVQILGVDNENGSEGAEVTSLEIDGEESVFIDIDSDYESDDPSNGVQDDLSE